MATFLPPLLPLLMLLLCGNSQALRNWTRPHVFMMLADDWGSYDASYRMKELGRMPDIATPTIDALGADGLRFANYYVQPICTPTRAGLLTGRYSIHTGSEHILFGAFEDSCLPVKIPLMQTAFKQLGYQTHAIGKWHVGYVNDTCAPWGRSFDSYLGYLNGNAGYYCNAKDFHECNVTSSSDTSPRDYVSLSGKMDEGPNANAVTGGAVQKLTYEKAVLLCDHAKQGCYGFSYPNDNTSTTLDVVFKQATAVNKSNPAWTSHISKAADPSSCALTAMSACNYNYEGEYSTHAYTRRAQSLVERWRPSDQPLFVYLAWQAVHEPMTVPSQYLDSYDSILDPSRKIYAGMLSALDEGIGNLTRSLKTAGMYDNTIFVLSNDNGGMSGSYGLGCCNCGTSCGGLNYPYRGWKDSFWEGGFRGIGFVHSPLLERKGVVYNNLLHVSDWYRTLISAALSQDSPEERTAAEVLLAPILSEGPIDSIDHWEAMNSGGSNSAAPRTEILLAGIDTDKSGAAIRVGQYKLLVGNWGADTWCDLNVSGFSPHYPAPVDPDPKYHGPGGEGGLYCAPLSNKTEAMVGAVGRGLPWTSQIKGLYNVVVDPRENDDLQHALPDVVSRLYARLVFWNATTVPSVHNRSSDPKAQQMLQATSCMSPWQDWKP